MLIRFLRRFPVFLLFPFISLAQPSSQVSLTDMTAFQGHPNSNWFLYKNIHIHPFKSGKIKTEAGSGILAGKPGQALLTGQNFGNVHLALDFMVAPEAKGAVVLPGGIKILLADSPFHPATDSSTIGYTGQIPLQHAGKAPGLWQRLEVFYDAVIPGNPGYTRINSLKINGVVIQQNIRYKADVTQPQPLKFQVDKGLIAFRHMYFMPLLDRKPLHISSMTYKKYSDSWDKAELQKLEQQSDAPVLSQEYGNGAREFHLVFEGNLTADEAGEYQFSMIYTGSFGQLEVDGKPVIDYRESSSQDVQTGNVLLSKGTHPFRLRYSKIPWRSAALGLVVEKEGIKPYGLHALSSLPEPEPKPRFSVNPVTQPEMVRSFIAYGDEKNKRTHCLSVGTPEGWHYTMDLNKGALLQVWRGHFANTTDMWYERGEPQLLTPAGLTMALSGRSSYALLTDKATIWPDSSGFDFKGYTLDKDRLPEIRFQKEQTIVYDKVTPSQNGIRRTIRTEGAPVTINVTAATHIEQVEKRLFRVDDDYYIQSEKGTELVLKDMQGTQMLLISAGKSATYNIIW